MRCIERISIWLPSRHNIIHFQINSGNLTLLKIRLKKVTLRN